MKKIITFWQSIKDYFTIQKPMFRIYFDENAGDERGWYDLGIPGSLRDIKPVAKKLANGLRVILYDGQEIEVEAVLEYNDDTKRWMALPLWETSSTATASLVSGV